MSLENFTVPRNPRRIPSPIPGLPQPPAFQRQFSLGRCEPEKLESVTEIVEYYFKVPCEKLPQASAETNLLKLIASCWIEFNCPDENYRLSEDGNDPISIPDRLRDLHAHLKDEGLFAPSFEFSRQVI
jgi:hypothetical protein